MKRFAVALPFLLLLTAMPAWAETPVGTGIEPAGSISISPGELSPTPEMWFYEQYLRHYQDPNMAIRQKAEFRTAQRQRRLAARRWFGLSNSRPTVGSDPYHGDYSPRWTSNNPHYAFRWMGIGGAALVVGPYWWIAY